MVSNSDFCQHFTNILFTNSHMNTTLQHIPPKNSAFIASRIEQISKDVNSPLKEDKNLLFPPRQLYPIVTTRNLTPCYHNYDDSVQVDCCTWSPDPLINGPGRCDCILATLLAVISIILLLIGTLLTVLHYIIGIEFYTIHRGRILGPVLLGLLPIPLLFMMYFMCMARQKVVSYTEQMALDYSARERLAYKQYQAELARSSIGIRSIPSKYI
ncbi:unnamed protein product [Trichobilharzia szidati]|nr:unnamed protein product [Trichobilharzia szidati]